MSKKKGGADKNQRPMIESDPFKLAGVGDTNGLKALMEREKDPIDVNIRDDLGCQPIVWAARNGYKDTMIYLVDRGADIESAGYAGMNCLHHACNQLRDGVLQELLTRGVQVNAVDDNGNTALHYACERGVLEPVDTLIAAGASVSAENNAKVTPLHKAANDGHLSIVQRLVKHGADVNAQDAAGNSALHIACMNRFKPMITWLLNNGANPNQKNKSSKTPPQLAGSLSSLFNISEQKEE